ncbi:MAG: hypothetical protein ACRDHS_08740 [Actinomycetota bacterium]
MTAATHPLFGQLLRAIGFKRLGGVLHLVVLLGDGSPGTIRAEATGVFGEQPSVADGTVLSVDGLRRLHLLVEASPARGRRSRNA